MCFEKYFFSFYLQNSTYYIIKAFFSYAYDL